MNIKIWDITTGDNPRTFASHKKRITDIAMIEKGRNFVSSSLDGTIKLWDCGSGSNFCTLKRKESLNDGVTSVHITEKVKETAGTETSSRYPEEFGTENKILLAGHISGVISGFDLCTKQELFSVPSMGGSVESISGVHDQSCHLIVGYSDGVVAKWDISDISKPLKKFRIPGKNVINMSLDNSIGLISNELSVFQIDNNLEQITLAKDDDQISGLKVGEKLYINTNFGDIFVYSK
ncbi:putative WD repeat-containing protein [Wickerhamomyces ciferrii]|uniref:WD repeat-containing protein n=1 Tax=Wickerhamomyces ciferrii (strain ATCC 14091 / BCRC 22168 / CBS 111 / JCM 3599 / NBRC 0793 / NRRL Y-1031 F-60-10) TaxID=1206466 RepID=K0KUY8_WICCF|nr:putative WD repeat-containing protein [Wickerhamomyces ciferrii]CCH45722.1 putative WD repeat-containing protein [Wickerhamomyces ciferrii]